MCPNELESLIAKNQAIINFGTSENAVSEEWIAKAEAIVLSETDFGEVFFFNYARQFWNECPVSLRLPDGKIEDYACKFYEYLYKRIFAHA